MKDVAAERAVLSGLYRYGEDTYIDLSDLISVNTFTIDANQLFYKCFQYLFSKGIKKLDYPSVLSAAHSLGFAEQVNKEIDHFRAITRFDVEKNNVLELAKKIKRLEITRSYHDRLGKAQTDLEKVDGTEGLQEIISLAEAPIFEMSNALSANDEDGPEDLSKGSKEYFQYLLKNPVQNVGFSTGYPRYDYYLGGGFRPGSVNFIAARAKTGKSSILLNICRHVVSNLNIPVLLLDTEMKKRDIWAKLWAMISGIDITEIETGQVKERNKLAKFKAAEEETSKYNMKYINVSRKSFQEIISICRRWIVRAVGLQSNGKAKPCLIVYDYLKIMSEGDLVRSKLQEYQQIGFRIQSLHDFALQYEPAIAVAGQLNREKDIASSDRIKWFSTSFALFKVKTAEEIANDGDVGNRKLIVTHSRYGECSEEDDTNANYINYHFKKRIARIEEGKTRDEILEGKSASESGEIVVENEESTIDF